MMTPSIKELQEKLQDLRGHFLTTRPTLPSETRTFTYQKPIHGNKPENSRGQNMGWEYVTEEITVTLSKFGVSEHEARCRELCKEIREVKDKIRQLNYKPIDHGENYATWKSRNPEGKRD